ncbi:hypothetical protein JYU34_002351 [Plutella xylostella]|uniref:DUF4780 domain-containing protein n=1 Tax=Plutella xylostella TaxID=51655 RepID=A0ABQ7QK08_PLUXY|nr:hypothetical protein JYU34_021110 [Plutella xylostella]KAG7296646.1 hypothetical protein JYU34_020466 [Plutella xylostella]KAG7305561.1 hypothetical protein JYU34_009644 [Plutella xylostella]KAG7309283.1 hypothetical protein JYU34_005223 [Plutella xylostella]KAG7311314.1 hypothetical protein JYU34_002351 [Plutella xylostella]
MEDAKPGAEDAPTINMSELAEAMPQQQLPIEGTWQTVVARKVSKNRRANKRANRNRRKRESTVGSAGAVAGSGGSAASARALPSAASVSAASTVEAPGDKGSSAAITRAAPTVPATTTIPATTTVPATTTNTAGPRRPTPRGSRGKRSSYAATVAAPAGGLQSTGERRPADAELTSAKRVRPDETISPRGGAKRAKVAPAAGQAPTYANVARTHLHVALVTVPARSLTEDQANDLKVAVQKVIIQQLDVPLTETPFCPLFKGKPHHSHGALKMWCEDDETLAWLKKTVEVMPSPVPNTKLAVIGQSELVPKVRAGLLVPDTCTDEPLSIQRTLIRQNRMYNVGDWTLYDRQIHNGKDSFLNLGIPRSEVPRIMELGRQMTFAVGNIYIRFFNNGVLGSQPPEESEDPLPTAPLCTSSPTPVSAAPVEAPTTLPSTSNETMPAATPAALSSWIDGGGHDEESDADAESVDSDVLRSPQ